MVKFVHCKPNHCNVAYIQETRLLTQDQIDIYMPGVPNLSSDDSVAIAAFISQQAGRCIRNFVLNINSGLLLAIIPLIQSLPTCKFVATRSNANSIRDLNVANLYFSLTALSVLLSSFQVTPPNIVMTVVSDSNTPYYDQIYAAGTIPKYRLSELSVPVINAFKAAGGVSIIASLNGIGEYNTFVSLILDPACTYNGQIVFIEIERNEIPIALTLSAPPIRKIPTTPVLSANVCQSVIIEQYPDLNRVVLYDNSSISLVKTVGFWNRYISVGILGKGITNHRSITATLTPGDL